MAKQTFTTGQVLTAAQMTSLQQTAMGGGAATAKTASYTLVAADAGATVIMNSASATTITVNTSLFSAGDTVFIQNIGAGVSTITAGTATVNTASSLALAQYESGNLYFTAAGASIFSKADGAAAGGGGMTLLSTTSLTGSTVDISSIDQTYTDLVAVISDVYMDNDTGTFSVRFNTISTGNYTFNTTKCNSTYATLNFGHSETAYDISGKTDETTGRFKLAGMITMPRYASATNKFATHQTLSSPDGSAANVNFGVCNFQTTSGISTITFRLSAGTFSDGTVYLYGVK